MMKILYISDRHLPLGPKEPIRPEMRMKLRWMNTFGENLADRFEYRLRQEALMVKDYTDKWLKIHNSDYHLIIDGGDNSLPLSRHTDRLRATRIVWTRQLKNYGESRLLILTGNHELGHGYEPESASYVDLMDLRKELFQREINRLGYGWEQHQGVNLIALDSELIYLASRYPNDHLISQHYHQMYKKYNEALQQPGAAVLVTHNTTRILRHLRTNGALMKLNRNNRKVILVGGHYHIQRICHRKGISIYWSGGASYPEPFLRWMELIPAPLFGFVPGGAGGIEIMLTKGKISAKHCPFGISCGFIPRFQ